MTARFLKLSVVNGNALFREKSLRFSIYLCCKLADYSSKRREILSFSPPFFLSLLTTLSFRTSTFPSFFLPSLSLAPSEEGQWNFIEVFTIETVSLDIESAGADKRACSQLTAFLYFQSMTQFLKHFVQRDEAPFHIALPVKRKKEKFGLKITSRNFDFL